MASQSISGKDLLKREFASRLSVNPSYSKRAFARDLRLSPAFVCHLMNGRKRLTPKVLKKITPLMDLDPATRLELVKESAGYVSDSTSGAKPVQVSTDAFSQISDWWYFAVLEYLETSNRFHDAAAIGRKLRLPKDTVEFALKRLQELDLICEHPKKPHRYKKNQGAVLVSSNTPNHALRKVHSQFLDKAKESVQIHSPDQKVVGTLTIACDPEDVEEVRRRWREFRSSVESFLDKGKDRKSVYTLVFEFFPLTDG